MAAISETGPDTRNSIARLWRDKETRSVIIQIVTLVVILTAVALILRNVVINLEAVGKEFSFDFFLYPAGYDITFSPFIDYSSRSTHLQAAVVGLLNTLLVAACGIVLATVMGFTMGILRLSKNWLVNRLVYKPRADRGRSCAWAPSQQDVAAASPAFRSRFRSVFSSPSDAGRTCRS